MRCDILTDLLLQMNDKQHQYLAQGRDISKSVDRAVGFKQAVTQDAHIEAAPKILSYLLISFEKVTCKLLQIVPGPE